MTDKTPSRLMIWLPYASLLITIAAFSAGLPAKLAHYRVLHRVHHRAAPQLVAENDFRDEPVMFALPFEARSWRAFDAQAFRAMIALK